MLEEMLDLPLSEYLIFSKLKDVSRPLTPCLNGGVSGDFQFKRMTLLARSIAKATATR